MALSCNPADIVKAAACFKCIPPTTAPLVKAYLLCQTAKIADPTNPCSTPSAPTALQVLNTSNTTIKVGWKQTKNTGSFITGYKVFWGTTSGGPYTSNSGVIPTLPRNYTITGLTAGTTYFVVVVALSAVPGCQSANSNEVSGTTSGAIPLPQLANLILQLESTDFDGTANGTSIASWNDKSGHGQNFNLTGVALLGNPTAPTVDGGVLANGHKTVRFAGANAIGAAAFSFAGVNGVEMMVVYRNDADPGVNGRMFELMRPNNATEELQPFSDGNFYECFGRTDRPSLGNPATSSAGAFCCYDVSSRSDNSSYDAWLNSEHFFTSAVYTFSNNQGANQTTLGCAWTGAANNFGLGNIAAVYAWNVSLSAAERTQARAYITALWGVAFP